MPGRLAVNFPRNVCLIMAFKRPPVQFSSAPPEISMGYDESRKAFFWVLGELSRFYTVFYAHHGAALTLAPRSRRRDKADMRTGQSTTHWPHTSSAPAYRPHFSGIAQGRPNGQNHAPSIAPYTQAATTVTLEQAASSRTSGSGGIFSTPLSRHRASKRSHRNFSSVSHMPSLADLIKRHRAVSPCP